VTCEHYLFLDFVEIIHLLEMSGKTPCHHYYTDECDSVSNQSVHETASIEQKHENRRCNFKRRSVRYMLLYKHINHLFLY